MSVFTPTRTIKESKVHHSQYIKTENKPVDTDTKPVEPVNPEQPEAK